MAERLTLRFGLDRAVEIDGKHYGPLSVVRQNRRYIVLKRGPSQAHRGQGRPWGYVPVGYIVFEILTDDSDDGSLTVEELISFDARQALD